MTQKCVSQNLKEWHTLLGLFCCYCIRMWVYNMWVETTRCLLVLVHLNFELIFDIACKRSFSTRQDFIGRSLFCLWKLLEKSIFNLKINSCVAKFRHLKWGSVYFEKGSVWFMSQKVSDFELRFSCSALGYNLISQRTSQNEWTIEL